MNFLITGKMKALFFLISLTLLGCGTDQGELKTYKYTVRNESGVKIKLKGYKINENSAPLIIELEDNTELTKTFEDGLPPKGPYGFGDFFESDSLIVIYNSEKFESFKLETRCEIGDERNPLNTCFHSINEEETFIFTEEDYQNAEPCNGACE